MPRWTGWVIGVLAAGLAAPAEAAFVQWTTGSGANNHWYEVVFDGDKGWTAAKTDAASRGGHLVTITSQGELDFVLNTLFAPYKVTETAGSEKFHGSYWIGLEDSTKNIKGDDDKYAWVTGETYGFNNFLAGSNQPDDNDGFLNGGPEDYIQMVWRTIDIAGTTKWIGGWNDVHEPGHRGISDSGLLHLNTRGYVVEYTTDPNVAVVPIPAALPLYLSAIAMIGFAARRRLRHAP